MIKAYKECLAIIVNLTTSNFCAVLQAIQQIEKINIVVKVRH